MKKLSYILLISALLLGFKCYYQKSRVYNFLDSLKEYGYSYEVTKSSFCSMDVGLKIEDTKKLINIYPKFLRESELFKKEILKELEKSRQSIKLQDVKVELSILSFDVVAISIYKNKNPIKGKVGDFMQHLSNNKLLKSTTTCNVLTNRCVSVYNDIDTIYNGTHYVVKGIAANSSFLGKRAFSGNGKIDKLLIKSEDEEFEFENLTFDSLYKDEEKFAFKEIISAKKIRIKDKDGVEGKFSNISIGGSYEDGKSFFTIKAKDFNLPDKDLNISLKNFEIYVDINKESGYRFNIDSLNILDEKKQISFNLDSFRSSYKFLDNNIYIAKGKTEIKSIEFKESKIGSFILKSLDIVSSPNIVDDKLNLKESYTLARVSLQNREKKFDLKDASFDLEVKDIGYLVIKDLYNEMKELYVEAFLAGFRFDRVAMVNIDKKSREIVAKYKPRYAEMLQYGIKIDLNSLGFKELTVDKKVARNLDTKVHLELKKITINDIMGKRYNKENLPIKSLYGKVVIPNTLFEITQTPLNAIPFKLEDKGEFKVINLSFKDGKVLINGEAVK